MASCDIVQSFDSRNPWEGWGGLPDLMSWLEADIAEEEASNPHLWADEDQSGDLCYFMGGETGPIKIGFARDPWSRLGRIQSGCAFPITVLAVEHGGRRRESAYHQEFNRLRVHGEWFERSPEMMRAIRDLQESMRETPLSPRSPLPTPERAS